MTNSKSNTSSGNDTGRTVGGYRISKRHADQRSTLRHYIQQKTGRVVEMDQFDHEWLRLIHEPQFQDKHNRRAQAQVVVEAATGGAADRKSAGRMLTMKCLDGGVGKTEAKKKRRARVVVRREVEGVLGGEVVGSEDFAIVSEKEESGGSGADDGADGEDGMEIDGSGDILRSSDDNSDGMDLDDNSNFNDSGLPPSSPLSGYGLPPPKTPAQHLFAAALPTPDSTPFAQWPQGPNPGEKLDDKDRRLQEKDAQIMYLIAIAEGRGYEVDRSEVDAYFAAWAAHAT